MNDENQRTEDEKSKLIASLLARLPRLKRSGFIPDSSFPEVFESAIIGLKGSGEILRYVAGVISEEYLSNNARKTSHTLVCSDYRNSNSNDFALASRDELDLEKILSYQVIPRKFYFPNG